VSVAPRVDFYVLAGNDSRARLKFACRIAEKAYLAGQHVFVWLDDSADLQGFDDLLWTFADRSFVPHELFGDVRQWQDTPVLLGCESQPQQSFDVLLNLGSEVPAAAAHAGRIAEIVDAEEPRRRAGRQRFRHYRELGLAPETHNIGADDTP
jgi:DNA polymerase-3 subunit chi